ncbi:HAMP domain-containing sensor histidine kinase [Desulfoplanes sp.]
MQNFSFKTKILFVFVAILVCALILPSLIYRHKMVSTIRQDVLTTASRQLHTVSWLLKDNNGPYSPTSLERRVQEIGEHVGVRITFVDISGRVVADSDIDQDHLLKLDNHASRPEIVESQTEPVGISVRFSSTIGHDLIYMAQKQTLPGIGPGIVRISLPYSEMQELLDTMTAHFLGIMALTMLIFAALTTLFARQLTQSITHLVSVAVSIGEGEYAKRVRVAPSKEFAPLLKAVNHMAEKIQTNIEIITSQKRELEAILNGMKEGVVTLDSKGNILEWNQSMETIFPDIVDKRGHRPIEAIRIPELETTCQAVIQDEEPHQKTVSLQLKTNDGKYYDVNIVPTGKKDIKAIVVLHNITEIKRLEMVRKDFVANVSHELRTPLTSIKGYTETLMTMDECRGDNISEFLKIILKHTDAMANILNNLLNLARLEGNAGTSEVSSQPVHVKAALAMAKKSIAHMAEPKQVTLEEDLPDEECTVLANPAQLEQVFKNLLENAVKYAPEQIGSITVRIKKSGEECLFEVEDNGPGIPVQDRERIFERFYRVEKDRNSKIAGTGLGLAICKHIILQHGGRIWVTSPIDHGSGTRFSFTLKKV